MVGNRVWRRDDVQRCDIRVGAAVYVGIRWVMAMRTRVRTMTVVGRGRRASWLWRP